MRIIAIFIGFLLLSTLSAKASFYSYSEWVQMPSSARNTYLAGAFDFLIGVANNPTEEKVARRMLRCVSSAGINIGQLAANVQAFAAAKPKLQSQNVPAILLDYLHEFCSNTD